MYIPRTTLWVILLLFILLPSIELWVFADSNAWYRPYIVWSMLIAVVFISQHLRHKANKRQ
ncbi:hypothetical protein [Sinobacterium norvegicum]|uniref:hypothetical protein n=1 Tax=Sinobacterium norvegicum TaxID=1641715 RepID=UPI001F2D84E4|nr:hypothetical protein [Sinobacterium norvegicum]